MNPRQLKSLAMSFHLLSEVNRLGIVALLAESGGTLSVGAICTKLGQSQPAISHHMALMRHSGLVAFDRRGKENYYHLADGGRFAEMASFLRGLETIADPPAAAAPSPRPSPKAAPKSKAPAPRPTPKGKPSAPKGSGKPVAPSPSPKGGKPAPKPKRPATGKPGASPNGSSPVTPAPAPDLHEPVESGAD